MSAIAGIARPGEKTLVAQMLDSIGHRGRAGREIVDTAAGTLGVAWTPSQAGAADVLRNNQTAADDAGDGHRASVRATDGKLLLTRDPLGVAPLYYGRTEDGTLCFASEVKALLKVTSDANELPPGHHYDGTTLESYFRLQTLPETSDPLEQVVAQLRARLETSVRKRISGKIIGSWLSGGLDSSTLAALARPHVKTLHTFAAGIPGAPDLDHAREVAEFIKSEHHEAIVNLEEMVAALPRVIFHLESFDALLVRSSITNYLVAQLASDYVSDVFSGEAGDELFAGYAYLKDLDPAKLQEELIDITGRLHNTALQRVDRSASAHGTVAHTAFTDPEVVQYAITIPAKYKLRDGVEKWILRRAMDGSLPQRVLNRTKAKFWEGAGVGDLLAARAEETITDDDFSRERTLPDGLVINTKEELMYYRIFAEHFGKARDLVWMGRTKGAPKEAQ
ncbi:MAG: asparagine synthase-related protein [Bacteroidota bacterium]